MKWIVLILAPAVHVDGVRHIKPLHLLFQTAPFQQHHDPQSCSLPSFLIGCLFLIGFTCVLLTFPLYAFLCPCQSVPLTLCCCRNISYVLG